MKMIDITPASVGKSPWRDDLDPDTPAGVVLCFKGTRGATMVEVVGAHDVRDPSVRNEDGFRFEVLGVMVFIRRIPHG